MISIVLREKGYKVILAQNGENGVSHALGCKHDLILCDTTISGINGFKVCKILKANTDTNGQITF